jgi:hypothetical protein
MGFNFKKTIPKNKHQPTVSTVSGLYKKTHFQKQTLAHRFNGGRFIQKKPFPKTNTNPPFQQ